MTAIPRVSGATLAPLWVMAPVTFLMGWGFAFTWVGVILICVATVLTAALFALQRSPAALAGVTVTMTLGWYIVFVVWPLALALPASLLIVAWEWHLRRRRTARRGSPGR